MKSYLSIILALILITSCEQQEENQKDLSQLQKPNVLLVVVDDMGWTDLGSFGSEINTPNLDKLANRGVRFTNYRVSVSCSPTRAMLLSGVDNHQVGLGTMGEMIMPHHKGKPGYEGYLNNRVASLAELLRDGGYHTYMAGKWHLGHSPGKYPSDRGFERNFGLLFGGASHWDDMAGLIAHETPAGYTMNGERLEKLSSDFYSTRSYTDFLINAIREQHGDKKPFLGYLAYTAPHDPLHVPEPWLSEYSGQYDGGYELLKMKRVEGAKKVGVIPTTTEVAPLHPMVRSWDSLNPEERANEAAQMQAYAGMITNIDYHFGRVMNFLEDIGELDNTLIIFMSDNGPNPWYSHDYPTNLATGFLDQFDNSTENIGNKTSHSAYGIGWASASSGPLNLFKMAVAEGGIKSPLIIAGKGVNNGGRISNCFTYVTDILPTLLDITTTAHPAMNENSELLKPTGTSMVSVLSGEKELVHEAGTLIAGEMFGGGWISDGTYKAVLIDPPYGLGNWELYNIMTDPGETKDLAESEEGKLQAFIEGWDKYAEEVGVIFPPSGEDDNVVEDYHPLGFE